MRKTIKGDIIGNTILFIGEHSDRVGKVHTFCTPIRQDNVSKWYGLSDLQYIARDIVESGYSLKISS